MGLEDFLVLLRKREPWRVRAECVKRDIPLSVFFPEVGKPTTRAKAICAVCPVQRECADFARRSHSDYGVWGGVTRGGRREAKDRPQRTNLAVPPVTILPNSPASAEGPSGCSPNAATNAV